MSGNFPRRGEIWQVHLPDENKRRPAVIISVNSRNETANSVIVVPLTTNLRPSPAHVLLHAGHGGLRHASMARCENLGYVHKSRLNRASFSGVIAPALLGQIERAILGALGIRPNTV